MRWRTTAERVDECGREGKDGNSQKDSSLAFLASMGESGLRRWYKGDGYLEHRSTHRPAGGRLATGGAACARISHLLQLCRWTAGAGVGRERYADCPRIHRILSTAAAMPSSTVDGDGSCPLTIKIDEANWRWRSWAVRAGSGSGGGGGRVDANAGLSSCRPTIMPNAGAGS